MKYLFRVVAGVALEQVYEAVGLQDGGRVSVVLVQQIGRVAPGVAARGVQGDVFRWLMIGALGATRASDIQCRDSRTIDYAVVPRWARSAKAGKAEAKQSESSGGGSGNACAGLVSRQEPSAIQLTCG